MIFQKSVWACKNWAVKGNQVMCQYNSNSLFPNDEEKRIIVKLCSNHLLVKIKINEDPGMSWAKRTCDNNPDICVKHLSCGDHKDGLQNIGNATVIFQTLSITKNWVQMWGRWPPIKKCFFPIGWSPVTTIQGKQSRIDECWMHETSKEENQFQLWDAEKFVNELQWNYGLKISISDKDENITNGRLWCPTLKQEHSIISSLWSIFFHWLKHVNLESLIIIMW